MNKQLKHRSTFIPITGRDGVPGPVKLEVKRLLRTSACGHRKHHFHIHKRINGGVVMRCKWTICQESRVIANAVLRAMVAR